MAFLRARVAFAVLAALGPAGFTRAAPAASDPIVIGVVAPFSGEREELGTSMAAGLAVGLEEHLPKSLLGRVKVELGDSGGTREGAAAAATRLVSEKGARLLVGDVTSSASLAVAAVAEQHQVPMITPTATNPRVTRDGERTRAWVFRACVSDPMQGTAMARFARQTLKLKEVAILRDRSSDYSSGLAEAFRAELKRLGGAVVQEHYGTGDEDFEAQLLRIRRDDPDAIYVPGYYTDVARIAAQARRLGLAQVLLGGDGWDSTKLLEAAAGAIQGAYITNHYASDDRRPEVRGFVEKFEEIVGEPPDALSALGYDTAHLVADALRRAKPPSRAGLRAALEGTRGLASITGPLTIDAHHDAVRPLVFLRVVNGAFQEYSTVGTGPLAAFEPADEDEEEEAEAVAPVYRVIFLKPTVIRANQERLHAYDGGYFVDVPPGRGNYCELKFEKRAHDRQLDTGSYAMTDFGLARCMVLKLDHPAIDSIECCGEGRSTIPQPDEIREIAKGVFTLERGR